MDSIEQQSRFLDVMDVDQNSWTSPVQTPQRKRSFEQFAEAETDIPRCRSEDLAGRAAAADYSPSLRTPVLRAGFAQQAGLLLAPTTQPFSLSRAWQTSLRCLTDIATKVSTVCLRAIPERLRNLYARTTAIVAVQVAGNRRRALEAQVQTPRRLSTPQRKTYSPLAAGRSETLKTNFQQISPQHAQSAGDAPNPSSPSARKHRDAAETSRIHSDLHTPTRARASKRHTPLKSILSSSLRPILPRELDYSIRKRTAISASSARKSVRFRDERLVEALSPYTQFSWSSPDTTPYHARISLIGGGSGDADDLEEQLAKLELLGSAITIKEHEKEEKQQEAPPTDQAVDEHRAYLQKKKDEDTRALQEVNQEVKKERHAREDEWSKLLDKQRADRRAKRAAAEKEKAQQREAAEALAKAQAQLTVDTKKRADDETDEAVQILIEQLDLIREEDKTAAEQEFVADLSKPPVTPAKIVNAISQEWEEKVAAAMGRMPGTSKVVGDRSDITAKALATLSNKTWLNDEIVNEYVRHVVDRALKQAGHTTKAQPPPFCALNSNWWNTIHLPGQTVEEGLKKVMRWAKRAKVGGANLLHVDKIFIPINASHHWMLLVIHGRERKMEFLNSMEGCGPSADRVFGVVYQYLALELGSAFDKHEWACVAGRSPQQDNGYDCGVFVCYNAVSLALKREPLEAFTAKDMILGRRQIAATLLNEGLTGEFELF